MKSDPILRLLDAITTGEGVPADIYTEDAVLDGTVPGWRFQANGPAAIARELSGWFTEAATLEDLERRRTPDGEVVTYLVSWEEGGRPHAAHHCHVLTIAGNGRIARDQVWCGGKWSASVLAEMGAMAHA